MTEITCLRCGNCCHYKDIDGTIKKCKYLIKLSNTTMCRIYPNRLGKWIGTLSDGQKVYCNMRKNVLFNFNGCPYNKKGLPFFNNKQENFK